MVPMRGGGRFIVAALGTVALLVAGLGITGWFTTGHSTLVGLGDAGRSVDVYGSIRPSTVELCMNAECVSSWTYELHTPFSLWSSLTLAAGVAFALALLYAFNRKLGMGDVPRTPRWIGYALGLAVIALALVSMFAFPPATLAYDILDGGQFVDQVRTLGITSEPSLGLGGFLAIAGVLLGMYAIFESRPHELPAEDEPAPERPRAPRFEHDLPPRGVETDPFRAPPQPPPIAVVRHERKATAPIEHDPDEPPPKLLR